MTRGNDSVLMPAAVESIGVTSRNRPIFLVGCHRSGTTLLRYLLDAHPSFACPPESKFVAALEATLRYPQALQGLASLGIDHQAYVRRLGNLVDGVLTDYARNRGKPRWIDKTPNYFRLLPFIDTMFQGTAQYLLAVRHPLDTVASLAQVRAFGQAHPDDPEVAAAKSQYGHGREAWCHYWRQVTSALITFAMSCPDRCLFVRYEDVVRRTDHALRVVLDLLGESLPAGLVAEAFAHDHTAGYEDASARASRSIYSSSVGRWRSSTEKEVTSAWSIVADVAEPLGYDVVDMAARPSPPSHASLQSVGEGAA